jgi:hypothetical protein
MKKLKYTSDLLTSCLLEAWKDVLVPSRHEINEILFDGDEIASWLDSQLNTEFNNDVELEVLMPFFYFSEKGLVYYILGYLLKMVEILGSDKPDITENFGCYHCFDFLISQRFTDSENLFTTYQRQIIHTILEQIKIVVP